MDTYKEQKTCLICSHIDQEGKPFGCGRRVVRTLSLPIDEKGRAAILPLDPTNAVADVNYSCPICNEGKSTPRRSLLPGDEDRIVQYAVAGEAPTIEDIAWTLHLREEDVKEVLSERGIEIAEYTEESE